MTETLASYSLAFWAYLESGSNNSYVSVVYDAGAIQDQVGLVASTNTLRMTVDGIHADGSFTFDNAWHYFVVVRSGVSRIDLYMDGTLVATNTTTRTDTSLLRFNLSSLAAARLFANIQLFTQVMSSADRAAQQARFYPRYTALLWLPFVDTASLATDWSSNHRTSTTGGLAYATEPPILAALSEPPVTPPSPDSVPASAATYTPTTPTIAATSNDNYGPVWVDVEDSTGTKLGSGPIAALKWSSTDRMDGAGRFSCDILANDRQIAQVTKRRILRAWMLVNGTKDELGAGVIDDITQQVQSDGQVVWTITGDDLLRELTWANMQAQRLAYRSGDTWLPVTHAQAVTLLEYWTPTTWTMYAAPAPLNDLLYGQFAGESVLQAAVKVAKLSRTHFYRSTGRTLIFASGFQASGLRATQVATELRPEICGIASLSIEDNSYDMVGRVQPYGAGQGSARLTLAATSRTAPAGYVLNKTLNYVENTSVIDTYGASLAQVQFNAVAPISNSDVDVQNAANALFDVAMEYLRDRSERQLPTYRISLVQCTRRLRPLQTIRVDYWDPVAGLNVDAELNILEASVQVDATGLRTTQVVVSAGERWPENDASTVVSAIQSNRKYQALPQVNANAYVLPFTKNLDDDQSNPANFRFRFDNEVTQIVRVTFDFQILAMESTVKSVSSSTATTSSGGSSTPTSSSTNSSAATSSAGGSSSPTSSSGGGATVTSNAGGSSTPTSGSGGGATVTSNSGGSSTPTTSSGSGHTHEINLANSTTGTAVYFAGTGSPATGDFRTSGGGIVNTSSTGSGHTHTVTVPAHSHDVVIAAHTHTVTISGHSHDVVIAAHTHTVTIGTHTHDVTIPGHSHTVTVAAHTHDVTPTVTMVYGVFRDSAGNTFALTDLEYSLDGTSWYGFGVGINGYTTLGDGWYRIDLTSLLQNPDTFRPLQANNMLRIRRKSAGAIKKCTIDAQLNVRTVIQAMALN